MSNESPTDILNRICRLAFDFPDGYTIDCIDRESLIRVALDWIVDQWDPPVSDSEVVTDHVTRFIAVFSGVRIGNRSINGNDPDAESIQESRPHDTTPSDGVTLGLVKLATVYDTPDELEQKEASPVKKVRPNVDKHTNRKFPWLSSLSHDWDMFGNHVLCATSSPSDYIDDECSSDSE